mmetsp:Transcript_6459/g.19616  ORF Transcript_6459/g.19616 Transcript_6459/m.19616 type:complete len:451 (+) Transcript_6459:30-1382(+)
MRGGILLLLRVVVGARVAQMVAGEEWVTGTYTTGYWDCCKPSCSWPGKGNVDRPVRSCEAETGATLSDYNTVSVCDAGTAASCSDNIPFIRSEEVTMGFAAAAVCAEDAESCPSGLNGDENCGQCFELEWTDEEFDYGGGSHPSIVGKRHVIQVTNIGYDVTGTHAFDLQIPSAGQGLFDTGCAVQFPGFDIGDFDCDNRYGGCDDVTGCDRLPDELVPGCEWRFAEGVYGWKIENGKSDNPYIRFRRVRCPDELVNITLSRPLDDDQWPDYRLTLPPTTSLPSSAPTPRHTLRPTRAPVTPAPSGLPTTASPSTPAPTTETDAPTTPAPSLPPTRSPRPKPTRRPTPKPTTPASDDNGRTGPRTWVVVVFIFGAIFTCIACCCFARGWNLYKERHEHDDYSRVQHRRAADNAIKAANKSKKKKKHRRKSNDDDLFDFTDFAPPQHRRDA